MCMWQACKYLAKQNEWGDWMPRITYIVAQKRNNTRLFLDNIHPGAKPIAQNPSPGTPLPVLLDEG